MTTDLQLTRQRGWEQRLQAVVQKHSSVCFEWGGAHGGSDCFMLAMDTVEALTGLAPYPDLKGAYACRFGALRRCVERGANWIGGLLDAKLAPVPVLKARRGDLGLVKVQDGTGGTMDACVVVVGHLAVGKSQTGVVRVPLAALHKAYRVG